MASGIQNVKVTSYDVLRFTWEETSQSITNNSTVISWKMLLVSGSNGAIESGVKKPWKVVVNGNPYSGSVTHGIANNTTKTLASGTTTIPHNSDGSKTFSYSFFMTFEGLVFNGVSVTNKSGSGTGTLTPIPRQATVTAAPNFTDIDNPTITYSNPAASAVSSLQACISLTGSAADIAYRSIDINGTSYTFNLTEAERNVLRNATTTANSRTIYFYIKTIIGGAEYYSYLAKTLTITNATPTVSPSVYDSNSSTTALTGDNSKFVKHYSNATFAIGAAAYKGATITSQKIVSGSKSSTTASGTLTAVDSGSFVFSASDSRGNTVSKTVNKTLIEYIKLSCNLAAAAPTTGGELTLTANGNYFNGTFGAVANTLTVEYRIKANSGSYGSWTAVTATKNGNTYTAAATLTGLDYRTTYTVQMRATDKLATVNSVEITLKTMPLFDWSDTDFNFNVPVNFSEGATGVGDSGEWLPALNASAISSYASQKGWYIKNDKVITVGFYIKATCKSGYESTGISISGLPFNPSISAAGGGLCSGTYVSSGFTFQCWVVGTDGKVTARVQQVNHTTATNLSTSASGCSYRSNGGEITLSGTITYITN